jgi:CubicO group peptidase (beta-lactamase class C family)
VVTWKMLEADWACTGVFSTVMDMAIFGQMFLNRGTYGNARVLSPGSVDAMTHNQIPGISARFEHEFFPEASWGLGWSVQGNKKPLAQGSLHSAHMFEHSGLGGVFLWIDPVYEIVGVYFSVGMSVSGESEPQLMLHTDLYANAVTAAIVDM